MKNKSPAQQTHQLHNTQRSRKRGISTICVYCGSGFGSKPEYKEAAKILGIQLARRGICLVYGGGDLGLMGTVARAVLSEGGHVTGIMPNFLSERERQLADLNDLIIVNTMHERKMEMFKRSDAFVALPGGIGTLEEFIEQLTWAQLGRHTKPIVLANIEGFWDPLLSLLDYMRQETFIRQETEISIAVVNSIDDIIPSIEKWSYDTQDSKDDRLNIADKF